MSDNRDVILYEFKTAAENYGFGEWKPVGTDKKSMYGRRPITNGWATLLLIYEQDLPVNEYDDLWLLTIYDVGYGGHTLQQLIHLLQETL